ncbi:MAG: zinc ribbon domain-containing protein, partial [Myxococcales bacterium]|nr:zinc ribbon domain-containing protein [Myxococcales bacterium]
MTVFCPNCGKPNTDEATKCVACGAELKKQGAKKFKGTMMMQTSPIAQKPGASEPAPGAVPTAPARPMSDRPQGP